ncbi:uncharacterized protein PRCAT00002226001 [Priceomyces carsonii]|uniref:uncharacterized protein n=1 Tax=Priceomyces carsonii TaxID=28549 RepID=UPI002EDB58EE|nr:unnamed protein product [Priceomyces carsonii]
MNEIKNQNYYKQGFEKSVSDTHAWRTVDNSAKFLIPYLKPTFRVLDVGSGPGTITIDLGRYIPKGSIIGVEPTEELIKEAKDNRAKSGIPNVDFRLGSAYELPFEDDTFDLVFCHQVLLHLQDPLAGLKEMKRVTKPGGFVCARESDLMASVVYPPRYETIKTHFLQKAEKEGSNVRLGRSLKELALDANFQLSQIFSTSSNWCISDDDKKLSWGKAHIKRIAGSSERTHENDEIDKQRKLEVISAWKTFIKDNKAWLLLVSAEVVCVK